MNRTLPNIPPYYVAPRLDYAMAQKLQVALQTNLSWLDSAYHIARAGIYAENKIVYPQIHANDGTKEHFDIRPDNAVASFSFFEVDNPSKIDIQNDEITYFFSIVFWCNLDLIDDTIHYDFSSDLIKDVIDVLSFYDAENFVQEQRPEKIFDKYNGLTQELKQYLMRRYSAFKISFSIKDSYSDGCIPTEINVCQMNIDKINNLPTDIKNCVILGLGGSGHATVENSDASYLETVDSGDTLILPDENFEFYLDGNLIDTETEPALSEQTFNINWQ